MLEQKNHGNSYLKPSGLVNLILSLTTSGTRTSEGYVKCLERVKTSSVTLYLQPVLTPVKEIVGTLDWEARCGSWYLQFWAIRCSGFSV